MEKEPALRSPAIRTGACRAAAWPSNPDSLIASAGSSCVPAQFYNGGRPPFSSRGERLSVRLPVSGRAAAHPSVRFSLGRTWGNPRRFPSFPWNGVARARFQSLEETRGMDRAKRREGPKRRSLQPSKRPAGGWTALIGRSAAPVRGCPFLVTTRVEGGRLGERSDYDRFGPPGADLSTHPLGWAPDSRGD